MTTRGAIRVRCSAATARSMGAKHMPSASAVAGVRTVLIETEAGLMFWPFDEAALRLDVGLPANRRPGAIV